MNVPRISRWTSLDCGRKGTPDFACIKLSINLRYLHQAESFSCIGCSCDGWSRDGRHLQVLCSFIPKACVSAFPPVLFVLFRVSDCRYEFLLIILTLEALCCLDNPIWHITVHESNARIKNHVSSMVLLCNCACSSAPAQSRWLLIHCSGGKLPGICRPVRPRWPVRPTGRASRPARPRLRLQKDGININILQITLCQCNARMCQWLDWRTLSVCTRVRILGQSNFVKLFW